MPTPEIPPVIQDMSQPPQAPAPTESAYQIVADKVGLVPNLRKSDNVFQAKFIGISSLAGGLAFLLAPWFGPDAPWFLKLGLGVVAGLILGVLISGTILAIRNLRRK